MKVVLSNWAWMEKLDLAPAKLAVLRKVLTVVPRKVGNFPGQEDPQPIQLWVEKGSRIGVAREYFMGNRSREYELEYECSDGWAGLPSPFQFAGKLREEQSNAVAEVATRFRSGQLGGLIQAACGWGKTVFACGLMAELQVPTLVVVHKEFLMDQWKERIGVFLPGAQIGHVQQDVCDFLGKHVVLAMVHTLAGRDFPSQFLDWPGLVITDEVHRIGAQTWSPVPGMFAARHRLGITATPRRKDGADKVFEWQIGPILFRARERRLKPKIRRVFTTFQLVKTPNFNPALAPKSLIVRFLVASTSRNKAIAQQLILALKAGRKPLVLSERLNHLNLIQKAVLELWDAAVDGPPPTFGKYVGGSTKKSLENARARNVVLATSQYAQEGLDVPELDTLFLTTPLSDVEQAVGRILREVDGKKESIVVDFRDDHVPLFKHMAEAREKIYASLT